MYIFYFSRGRELKLTNIKEFSEYTQKLIKEHVLYHYVSDINRFLDSVNDLRTLLRSDNKEWFNLNEVLERDIKPFVRSTMGRKLTEKAQILIKTGEEIQHDFWQEVINYHSSALVNFIKLCIEETKPSSLRFIKND